MRVDKIGTDCKNRYRGSTRISLCETLDSERRPCLGAVERPAFLFWGVVMQWTSDGGNWRAWVRARQRKLVLLLVLTAISPIAAAAAATTTTTTAAAADLSSPVGLWAPIDDQGRPLGLIRIFEQGGAFYGRIEPSSPTDDFSARCTRCTGDRKNQPIIGLVIMRHLRLKDDEYVGGDILDPRTGGIYSCKFHLMDGGRKLRMRGYLGIPLLGRSLTWVRIDKASTTAYPVGNPSG